MTKARGAGRRLGWENQTGVALFAAALLGALGGGCGPECVYFNDCGAGAFCAADGRCQERSENWPGPEGAPCTGRNWDSTCPGALQDPGPPTNVQTGPIALSADGRSVYAALPDHDEVVRIDTATLEVIGAVAVPGYPHRLTRAPDGTVLVAARDAGTVTRLASDLSQIGWTTTVGASPYGMAIVNDGVAVALSGEQQLAWLDLTLGTVVDRTPLAQPDPRGLVVRDDGLLVVAHFSPGGFSVVEPGAHRVLGAMVPSVTEGQPNHLEALVASPVSPTRVELPMHFCAPNPGAFAPIGGTAVSYYVSSVPVVVGGRAGVELAVVGEDDHLSLSVFDRRLDNPVADPDPAVGAIGMALLNGGEAQLVVHQSTGNLRVLRMSGQVPLRMEDLQLGVGLEAAVVLPGGAEGIAWNPLENEVTRFAIGYKDDAGQVQYPLRFLNRVQVRAHVLDDDVVRGRRIFTAASDATARGQAIACVSCHPGGQDDAMTWAFPEGPRQTQPLWGGILDTMPLHWDQLVADLGDLNEITVQGRMGGEGLNTNQLKQLGAFLDQIPVPRAPMLLDEGAVARGRALFESPAVGCRSCHSGPAFTDGLAHDVGTSIHMVNNETLEAIATPMLRGLASSGPWMHDGSAGTLEQLVELYVRSDRMGHGSQLTDDDAADLVAYLKSL